VVAEIAADADASTADAPVTAAPKSGKRGSYLRALRVHDLRVLMGALTISAIGSWAYNVALVVFIYDQTHSPGWVAAASVGRFIPALVFSTYAGVVAERFERTRVLIGTDVLCAAYMTGMAIAMATTAPVVIVIVLAALTSTTGSAYQPATGALVPQVVDEDDLAAANGIEGAIDNLAILVGPAIAGVLLLGLAPASVVAVNAASFAVSAALVSRLRVRSVPTDVTREGGPIQQMLVGIKAIGTSSTAAVLVGFSVLASFLYGTDTVLFVVVSKAKLGTGAEGYGYLLTALGVGGLLAAGLVNRFAASRRLGLVITVGLVLYCAPTALLVVVHSPTLAFIIEVIRGGATLIVDALALTALQRSLAPDLIARVFGVFFALVLGAISLGSLLMPQLLRAFGLDATLLIVAFGISGLVILAYPWVVGIDRTAAARLAELQPRILALEALGIFAAASRPVIERLAAAATDVVETAVGQDIVTEGAPADAIYALLDGEVEVRARGEAKRTRRLRVMTAPSYFGEIGVIEHIPRTATVRTLTPVRLLRIDGDEFLAALTVASPSASLVDGLSGRLARTHPSYRPGTPVETREELTA
jgi:predicted MFS family arabinose efflux permease